MKVLVVGYRGSSHVQAWCRQLQHAGLEVVCYSPFDTAYAKGPSQQGMRQVVTLPGERRSLRRRVVTDQPDVIHAHIASSAGIISSGLGVPTVITAYGSDIVEFPNRSRLHSLALRRALTRATAVTVSSRYLRDAVLRLGIPTRAPHVVPFGVNLEAFDCVPASRHREGAFTIGTVKNHEHIYGIDILIRAFAIARGRSSSVSWRLIVVGGGSRLHAHQELAARLGLLEVVEFRGPVAHAEVPQHLAEMDVFAALSREESFGVAVVEAMAAGIPCVVSDVGGLPEVVGSAAGLITPREDVQAVADSFTLLHSDAVLRRRLADQGRARARSLFSDSVTCRLMVDVLTEAAACR